MKRRTILGGIAATAASATAGLFLFTQNDTQNSDYPNVPTEPGPRSEVTTPENGYLTEGDVQLKQEEIQGKAEIHTVLAAEDAYETAYFILTEANGDIQTAMDALEQQQPNFEDATDHIEYARLNIDRAIRLANDSRNLLNTVNESEAVEQIVQSIQNMSQYTDLIEQLKTLNEEYQAGNRGYANENASEIYNTFESLKQNNIPWPPIEITINFQEYYRDAAQS